MSDRYASRIPARASLTGLAIAWGGTARLISPAARVLGDPARLQTALIGQIVLWTIAAAVVAIALFWEKQPLASLWLKPFRSEGRVPFQGCLQSIGWALALLVVNYAVVFPVSEWVRRATSLSGFSQGMEQVMRFLGMVETGAVRMRSRDEEDTGSHGGTGARRRTEVAVRLVGVQSTPTAVMDGSTNTNRTDAISGLYLCSRPSRQAAFGGQSNGHCDLSHLRALRGSLGLEDSTPCVSVPPCLRVQP